MNTKRKVVKRRGDVSIIVRSKRTDEPEAVIHRRQPVDDLPEHPAHVQVVGGITKNLGNYESAKLGISITVPCHATDSAIRKTYKEASALVEELLECEYEKVMDT